MLFFRKWGTASGNVAALSENVENSKKMTIFRGGKWGRDRGNGGLYEQTLNFCNYLLLFSRLTFTSHGFFCIIILVKFPVPSSGADA